MIQDLRTDDEAPPREIQRDQESRLLRAWRPPTGIRYWSDVNNSIVGLWYTAATLLFLAFGGVLALLMRIQLAIPNNRFLDAETYNQVFTVHGSVMMFLFAIPIFEAFSILFLPQMLGSRDLPFPRLSAFGFWVFLFGGIALCSSLFFGAAPKGGWFMYPPLTSAFQPGVGADMWLLGFSFIEVAAIAASVELIIGILMARPPGMRINLIPLYSWYVLVAGVMVLFAFPPLILGSLMLELERAAGWPFFDAARGGDPLLWQHLFWLFGHPEVYIIFLPSVALAAMIIPTFARTPIVGYTWIVLSAVGTGFLSFGLWVHHMFTTGLPLLSLALFSAASQAVAIPTGIQIACFVGTILAGNVVRSVPMLYLLGGLTTFLIGGLTGVMVAVTAFDFQAHDTYFVVAHLHSVLIGGTIFPFVAAIYYFYPLVDGKLLSDRLGRIGFWLLFFGFNVTFLPMHFTGLMGMPRRVYSYAPGLGLETLNLVSSLGALLLVAGFAVFFWDVFRSKKHQNVCERNPWNAGSLEWLQEMPGKTYGMRSIPEVDSRYPLWDQPNLIRDVDEGRFYLPDAEEGKREMLITSVIDAQPLQCMRVPGPSFIPLLAAFTLAGVFLFPTFKMWWPTVFSAMAALGVILYWLWSGTGQIPEKPEKNVGHGKVLPIYVSGSKSAGWWAMLITMLAVFTAFVSLLFAYLFYWTRSEEFVPASYASGNPYGAWAALGLTALAWLCCVEAKRQNELEKRGAFYLACGASCAAAGLAGAAFWIVPAAHNLVPEHGAFAATIWLFAWWNVVSLGLGVIMNLYCVVRRWAGRMDGHHDMDIVNTRLYWHFAGLTGIVSAGILLTTGALT